MNLRTIAVVALSVAAIAAVPSPGSAQLGKLKDKVKAKVDAKIDKKVDCTLDKVIDKKECEKQNAATAKNGGSATAGGDASAASAGGTTAALKPGEGAWANFDFVPGDRILFAEDFTVDRVGNFPKRLELEEGTMEVVEWPQGSGKRWIRQSSDAGFTITLPETLPERWTMEFDVAIPWVGMYVYPHKEKNPYCGKAQCIEISGTRFRVQNASGKEAELDPRNVFKDMAGNGRQTGEGVYVSRPYRVRVQADGAYMKVYLDEQRLANMPNMGRWQGNTIRFDIRENNVGGTQYPGLISNISINAGGRELYDALMANGRLAVQGIYFNTGSAEIRPESSGTLAEIVDMLKSHADLKLTVEGHTDNVGDAGKNRTLSEERAAAVVSYLTSNGIAADRLKSAGFGDSKPAAANDSPENRQKNRRVELVKM